MGTKNKKAKSSLSSQNKALKKDPSRSTSAAAGEKALVAVAGASRSEMETVPSTEENLGYRTERMRPEASLVAAAPPASTEVEELGKGEDDGTRSAVSRLFIVLRELSPSLVSSMNPLSHDTLSTHTGLTGGVAAAEHLRNCRTITDLIHYDAAAILMYLVEKCRPEDKLESFALRRDQVNTMRRSIVKFISDQAEIDVQKVAAMIQIDHLSTPAQIEERLCAMGLFVQLHTMKEQTLQLLCEELEVEVPPRSRKDHVHVEFLALHVCTSIYPSAVLPLPTELLLGLRVEEGTKEPKIFTMTLMNARLLLLPRIFCCSNVFLCFRVEWRASVEIQDRNVTLSLWHTNGRDALSIRVSVFLTNMEQPVLGRKRRVGKMVGPSKTVDDVVKGGEMIKIRPLFRVDDVEERGTLAKLHDSLEDTVTFYVGLEEVTPEQSRATLEDLVAEEELAKEQKAQQKSKQLMGKRLKQLEASEQESREKFASASISMLQMIAADFAKGLRGTQKKKERPKKEETIRLHADPELEAQLLQLQQLVQTAKQAVGKAVQERNKEEKDLQKTQAQLEERHKELEELRTQYALNEEELAHLKSEVTQAEEHERKLEERRRRRDDCTRSLRFELDDGFLPGTGFSDRTVSATGWSDEFSGAALRSPSPLGAPLFFTQGESTAPRQAPAPPHPLPVGSRQQTATGSGLQVPRPRSVQMNSGAVPAPRSKEARPRSQNFAPSFYPPLPAEQYNEPTNEWSF